jgi:hypothetical protein
MLGFTLLMQEKHVYTFVRLIVIQMLQQPCCILDGVGGFSLDALMHDMGCLEQIPLRVIQQYQLAFIGCNLYLFAMH